MGERIRRAVHADIKIAGFTVLLRASVGVAWTDQPIEAMTLVRQADTAMYQSKTTPGFPAVLYHSRPATPARRPAPLSRLHTPSLSAGAPGRPTPGRAGQ
jgi:GGDEF domain-containing protein